MAELNETKFAKSHNIGPHMPRHKTSKTDDCVLIAIYGDRVDICFRDSESVLFLAASLSTPHMASETHLASGIQAASMKMSAEQLEEAVAPEASAKARQSYLFDLQAILAARKNNLPTPASARTTYLRKAAPPTPISVNLAEKIEMVGLRSVGRDTSFSYFSADCLRYDQTLAGENTFAEIAAAIHATRSRVLQKSGSN